MNKAGSAVKKRPVTVTSFPGLKDIDIPVKPKAAFNDLTTTTRDGAVQWLEANIRRARDDGAFVVDEILTAALARELLDRNPENRPIVAAIVSEMACAMGAGQGQDGFYGMNGETIKISVCGLLNDGQHRCHAKLASGADIRTRFMFGLPREARMTVDQGRTRRASDYLSMSGHECAAGVAAIAQVLWYWENKGTLKRADSTHGHGRAGGRLGPSKKAEYAAKNYDRIKRSYDAIPKSGCGLLGGSALIGFAHVLFAEKSFAAATDFVERLVRGTDLSERSPILVCRERLLSGSRLHRHERWELILRAWNAWRENREVTTLPVKDNLPKISK